MKKTSLLLVCAALCIVLLTACTAQPQPTATPTATAIPTLAPTKTPAPTSTAETLPDINLTFGQLEMVKEGGFSFTAPVGYSVNIDGPSVFMQHVAEPVIFANYGVTDNRENKTPEALVDDYMTALFNKIGGQYKKEFQFAIKVHGADGESYTFSGTFGGQPVVGRAVILVPNQQQYFFGMGFADITGDEKKWEKVGSQVFNDFVNSITFLPVPGSAANGCKISTDPTYGYTQENAIKVGGDAMGGPSRERAYLDNLLGPNGEKLTYVREGSLQFGGTILDEYTISGLAKTETLYIDEYAYTELQAPVGFTCRSAFPLSQP